MYGLNLKLFNDDELLELLDEVCDLLYEKIYFPLIKGEKINEDYYIALKEDYREIYRELKERGVK